MPISYSSPAVQSSAAACPSPRHYDAAPAGADSSMTNAPNLRQPEDNGASPPAAGVGVTASQALQEADGGNCVPNNQAVVNEATNIDFMSATANAPKDALEEVAGAPSGDRSDGSKPAAALPPRGGGIKTEQEGAGESEITPSKRTRDERICGVCKKDTGRYKCPKCSLSYCSVACNRLHKENHPPEIKRPPNTPQTSPEPTNPQAYENDPYRVLLEHSADIERLFSKYPHLPQDLLQIHRMTLRPGYKPRKRGPRFGGVNQRYTWSRDEGLRKGAAALRKARVDPSERGDGVREYCELVLYLLSKPGGSPMAVSSAREQAKQEDLEIVQKLHEDEKDSD